VTSYVEIDPVASNINIVTLVNYAARGTIYNCINVYSTDIIYTPRYGMIYAPRGMLYDCKAKVQTEAYLKIVNHTSKSVYRTGSQGAVAHAPL